ncbi:hypothetical protein MMC28_008788 [Mycoblastus sanguinarius]|nr:hypothetical protein [Mycoblastus sanguinarius]
MRIGLHQLQSYVALYRLCSDLGPVTDGQRVKDMNLSNLVHRPQQHSHQQNPPTSNQRNPDPQKRILHDHRQDMASALTASPYTSQSPVYTRSPQPPPSPPSVDALRQLPSIQSLIGRMNVPPPHGEQHCKLSPQFLLEYQAHNLAVDVEEQPLQHPSQGGEHQNLGHRPQTYGPPPVSNPNAVPPSPPIDPQLGFDGSHQSPSATSSHSSTSGPQYFGGAINNLEPHQQRQPPPPSSHPGHSMPAQPSQSPYQNSPYPPSPSAASSYSYPSPAHPAVTGGQAMYFQRPLPNNFPPPNLPSTINAPLPNSQDGPPIDANNPNQWQHQHHHYIAPSSSTNFTGQSQDRYVCQVCNKAFSRPSSLRIHSHSHTGEKPFQCPHKGCGKAFSVRSNMKRHERGCHGGGSPGGGT